MDGGPIHIYKKSVAFQKYPDTCGRSLKSLWRAISKNMWFRCPDSLVSCGQKTDSYKKICGFKSIRIRVDVALGTFLVSSVI